LIAKWSNIADTGLIVEMLFIRTLSIVELSQQYAGSSMFERWIDSQTWIGIFSTAWWETIEVHTVEVLLSVDTVFGMFSKALWSWLTGKHFWAPRGCSGLLYRSCKGCHLKSSQPTVEEANVVEMAPPKWIQHTALLLLPARTGLCWVKLHCTTNK
jgi:hypothetical protein